MDSVIKFKLKPVADLIPYAQNSRTHSDEQVAQIAASIKEFGFTNPVLVGDDNVLIAGHGRVMAARKLRMREVPAMVISGLSEVQRKALVLADNRLALSAGWDVDLLKLEMQALADEGYDMALTGFDEDEINKFLADATEGLTDADEEQPAPPADPITKPGDTWLLGNHRLRCGDSTSAMDVEQLLAGVTPHLMVTDPPYGVEYDAGWRNEAAKNSSSMGIRKDTAKGKVTNDDKCDWREAWALFPGEVAYVWHADKFSLDVGTSLREVGFELRSQVIWAKSYLVVGCGHYHYQHEPCWYAVRKKAGATGHGQGDRKQTPLWQIDKPQKSETGHRTQKPIDCMKRPIENNSSPGQAIYEPFSGSGTTIIAAEMTGRLCYAMEIDPGYCDVAVARWEKFTGQKAVLENEKVGKAQGAKTAKGKKAKNKD